MSDLEELIAHGEGDRLEFKKTINHLDKIARTLTAFANTKGGVILVGVLDNGKICGIDPEEEKHSLQKAAQFYCAPPVRLFFKEVEDADGLTVLKTIVPESQYKPHLAKSKDNDWRNYVRIKDESVQTNKQLLRTAPAEEVTQQPYKPENYQESMLLLQLQQQPRITLKQFMSLAHISQERASRILVNLVLHNIIRVHDQEKEPYYTLK
ncbi:AlbA family DNA-binding domain-containing protein [Adhaeribacter rhizoryzae]|uniref:ATP-binding protein n=1 Tax=Adhaeribacter rhizoryzae TaxID=2607907 RepID=A0A5M6DKI4_9BACT|nr:ATP-binding protein [Adhaeribacter rhizoryzae]KAA5547973.1 ATP-binding protein [Adhaeribacter rhizoryzae]